MQFCRKSDLRFVCKDPGNRVTELVTYCVGVAFVCPVDELLDDIRVHEVRIRIARRARVLAGVETGPAEISHSIGGIVYREEVFGRVGGFHEVRAL